MSKLTFTNAKGEYVTFDSTGESYRLISLDGTGGAEADVQTQKAPFQDGATYVDSSMNTRPIALEFVLRNRDPAALAGMRRLVSRVFNPKLGVGTLRYEFDGFAKELEAAPESSPFFPMGDGNRLPGIQRATVDLLAPNPYWTDPQTQSRPLTAFVEAFTFPFEFGVMFGSEGDHVTIDNKGDVDAPVLIQIHGPVTNPRIENATTGEFIVVNRAFSAGETLEIDTDPQHKRVEAVQSDGTRINVFNWLDLDSTFWKLIPGENEIKYSAYAGTSEGTVTISYKNHYVGI